MSVYEPSKHFTFNYTTSADLTHSSKTPIKGTGFVLYFSVPHEFPFLMRECNNAKLFQDKRKTAIGRAGTAANKSWRLTFLMFARLVSLFSV